jgi:uncharacterized FlaG/YvyC family protein
MARATSSATLTPRPKGDFEAKPEKTPQTVRELSEPGEQQSSSPAAPAMERTAPGPAGVSLRIDAATKRVVAQIVDEANHVIKQIPPEELLKVAAKTRQLQGLLFDREA